jgi:ribosomal protein L11 methylase PrmA
MLTGLHKWIASLEPLGRDRTIWSHYAENNSYTGRAAAQKREFVERWAAETRPKMVWDLGCNTGEYSAAALRAGAGYVVGFDFDQGTVDRAVSRARAEGLPFLPLYLDATNPAPNQGWNQRERKGLNERASCDGLLALALVHHLCIARNVPMEAAIDWIMALAPTGVVEFVPKSDPMVGELLRLRDDIFDDYEFVRFAQLVQDRGEILRTEQVLDSDRRLLWYRRS